MSPWRLQSWGWALALPSALFLLAFFAGPLIYLFFVSVHTPSASNLYGAELTLANYLAIVRDPFYRLVLARTLGTAAAILGLCLVVGYPVAMVVAKLQRGRREIAVMLLLLPLMVSNVVRAYGWVAILGRRGLVNTALGGLGAIDVPLGLLYTPGAVVVGLATILLPYMVISIANTLASLDPRYEEAAQALGAGPIRSFLFVTLPLSSPGVASGLLLVFLLTLSAYVTVTLLGGPPSKMLVSLVYDSVTSFQWPRAAALAFVLLAAALAVSGLVLAVLRPERVRGRRA